MKKINSLIVSLLLVVNSAQAYMCSGTTITDEGARITLCASDYSPNYIGGESVNMRADISPKYYTITGRVELEQVQYADFIVLREEDDNGNTINHIATFASIVKDDIRLFTKYSTGHIVVDIYCYKGATCETSGFDLEIIPTEITNIQQGYIADKLGIGTDSPTEALDIKGSLKIGGNSNDLTISADGQSVIFSTKNDSYYYFDNPIGSNGDFFADYNKSLTLSTYDSTRITILNNNGFVGIGTNQPKEMLDVNGYIRGNGTLGTLKIRTDAGTTEIGAHGWSASHFWTSLPRFYFYQPIMIENGELSSGNNQNLKLQTFRTTHLFIENSSGNIGIGTEKPAYKLDVNGTLRATDIFVSSEEGADYVFDDNYKLQSLREVQAFIEDNHHLPGIPSAKEMKEDGVNINELQIKLLQKIEELTLYIIKQENKIKELEAKLNQ